MAVDLTEVFGDDYDPDAVTEREALTLPAYWRAVNLLAGTCGSLPSSVMRSRGNWREPVDHYLNRQLKLKANPFQTAIIVDRTWFSHAVTWGNGYQIIERDDESGVAGRYNLPPEHVTPVRIDGEIYYWIDHAHVKHLPSGRANPVIVPASEILHLAGLGYDGLCGYPVVEMMSRTFSAALHQQSYDLKFAEKGTMYGLSIEVPGSLPEKRLQRMEQAVKQWRIDPESVPVLTNGAKIVRNAIAPEHAQQIENKEFSVTDICRITGVPPHMLYQMGRATYSNTQNLGRELVTYSFREWIEQAEQERTSKLLTEQEQDEGYYVHYNLDALLRGDAEARTDNIVKLTSAGLMAPNEARSKLELPPVPGGDTVRVPFSYGATPPPAPAQGSPAGEAPPTEQAAASKATLGRDDVLPILAAACERVDNKTRKALDGRETPTPKLNVFAEQQAGYVRQELTPLVGLLAKAGVTIDLDKVCNRYDLAVKRYPGTGEISLLGMVTG